MARIKNKAKLFKRTMTNARKERNDKYYIASNMLRLMANEECQVTGERTAFLDCHHKAGRGGKLMFHPDYLVMISRKCHDAIHQHPSVAVQEGLIIRFTKAEEEKAKSEADAKWQEFVDKNYEVYRAVIGRLANKTRNRARKPGLYFHESKQVHRDHLTNSED